MKLNCKICEKEYVRFGKQSLTSKCCSSKCLGVLNKGINNTICTQCGKEYHLKESMKKRYKRTHGYFCSTNCISNFRKLKYLGEENPNFRKQTTHENGYRLMYLPKIGRIKLHHKVVFETLNIDKLPKGYCVHHRDCNIENNSKENLVLLTNSDHRWIHKQFGNATLWAFINNKIDLKTLSQWSNDIEKTNMLLPLNILDQIGVFKQGELLENPKEDNQQPSLTSNSFEGSTTNIRIQTDNAEDSNDNTSALPGINKTTFNIVLNKNFNSSDDIV